MAKGESIYSKSARMAYTIKLAGGLIEVADLDVIPVYLKTGYRGVAVSDFGRVNVMAKDIRAHNEVVKIINDMTRQK